MKKILAMILSLTLVCAVATGCDSSSSTNDTNSSSSSSQAETTSKTTTTTSETTTTTTTMATTETTTTTAETQPTATQASETEKTDPAMLNTLTYKMQKSLEAKQFAIDMTMTYMTLNIPVKTKTMNDNSYFSMDMSAFGGEAMPTEIYTIDGKTYAVNPATKTYSVSDGSGNTQFNLNISNSFTSGSTKFVGKREENGMVIETLSVTQKTAQGENKVTQTEIYFDKATSTPKKIEATQNGVKSVVTFNSFVIGPQEIKLPDLTGWTKTEANQGTSPLPFLINGGGQSGAQTTQSTQSTQGPQDTQDPLGD